MNQMPMNVSGNCHIMDHKRHKETSYSVYISMTKSKTVGWWLWFQCGVFSVWVCWSNMTFKGWSLVRSDWVIWDIASRRNQSPYQIHSQERTHFEKTWPFLALCLPVPQDITCSSWTHTAPCNRGPNQKQ